MLAAGALARGGLLEKVRPQLRSSVTQARVARWRIWGRPSVRREMRACIVGVARLLRRGGHHAQQVDDDDPPCAARRGRASTSLAAGEALPSGTRLGRGADGLSSVCGGRGGSVVRARGDRATNPLPQMEGGGGERPKHPRGVCGPTPELLGKTSAGRTHSGGVCLSSARFRLVSAGSGPQGQIWVSVEVLSDRCGRRLQ